MLHDHPSAIPAPEVALEWSLQAGVECGLVAQAMTCITNGKQISFRLREYESRSTPTPLYWSVSQAMENSIMMLETCRSSWRTTYEWRRRYAASNKRKKMDKI